MPFPICTVAGGDAQGVPDVCKVPSPAGPVPTPFVNMGALMMGAPPVTKVLVEGCPALSLTSAIPLSQGDEAGAAGGVASGTIVGEVRFLQGSACLFLEGAPAVFMTCQTVHNNNNAVGLVATPSQAVAFVSM